MELIGSLLYSVLPAAAAHNVWFILAVVILYAVISEIMPFLPTKYNGPAHMVLDLLGVWKVKLPAPIYAIKEPDSAETTTKLSDDPMNQKAP